MAREVWRRLGTSGDGRRSGDGWGGLAMPGRSGDGQRSGDGWGGLAAARGVRRPAGLAMGGIWSAGPSENGGPGPLGTDAGAAPTASSGSTGRIEPSRTGDLPLSPTVDLPPVPVQGAKGDSRPRPGSTRQPRRGWGRWGRCWPFTRVPDHGRAAARSRHLVQGVRWRRPARSPAAGVGRRGRYAWPRSAVASRWVRMMPAGSRCLRSLTGPSP
jgi:hypothetical protein